MLWTVCIEDIPTGLNASRMNLGTRKVPLCITLKAIVDVTRRLARLLILKDTERAVQRVSLTHLYCIIMRQVNLALPLLIVLRMNKGLASCMLDYFWVFKRVLYNCVPLEFFFRQEWLMFNHLRLDVDADVLRDQLGDTMRAVRFLIR